MARFGQVVYTASTSYSLFVGAVCFLQVAIETELRGLNLQANSLRKQHDKLVQDRLSSTSRLAQLRDGLKVCMQLRC